MDNKQKEKTASNFFDAIGVDKNEFSRKNASMSAQIVLQTITGREFRMSDMAKEISETFTQKELIASATLYCMKITEEAIEAKSADIKAAMFDDIISKNIKKNNN
tara:strand:- start:520 stop:834 length:315 start_codon:yes stop_codon:yes gene_type:complete